MVEKELVVRRFDKAELEGLVGTSISSDEKHWGFRRNRSTW